MYHGYYLNKSKSIKVTTNKYLYDKGITRINMGGVMYHNKINNKYYDYLYQALNFDRRRAVDVFLKDNNSNLLLDYIICYFFEEDVEVIESVLPNNYIKHNIHLSNYDYF